MGGGILNLINGEHRPASNGATMESIDPARARAYATLPASSAGDIEEAVEAARRAFPAWSSMPSIERTKRMMRLARLLEESLERLAAAEAVDSGKPISLARAVDIPRAISNFRFFAGAVQHWEGRSHDMGEAGFNYTLRRARGVAGCISPWNLPLYLFTWKIAPALATGNTVVAKPSEVTPMTAAMLGEMVEHAGFPPGVLNIVHGRGDEAGAAIITHPDVPSISFTGSTRVGEWIAQTAGPMFKRLSLELGGKNPFIVMGDADVKEAIAVAARSAFTNQGQICLCGSRLLVHESIAEEVIAGVVERAKALRIGDPLDGATQHGAMVSVEHMEKVAGYVEQARDLGGEVLTGGRRVDASQLPESCAGGAFYEPTVIRGLANDCAPIQEEIFGPVVTVQTFADEQEALALANSTPYGLSASIWTRDLSTAHRMAAGVNAGIVWVNCWMVRDLRTAFGGMGQSGVGREGGVDALNFFTEAKNVCVRL